MLLDEKKLIKKVDERLNLMLENDSRFQSELQYIQAFYLRKFQNIIKEEDKNEFNEWLQKSMMAQYHNGYLMIEQYYNDENAYIEETIFTQPEGIFTDNVPRILKEITQPVTEQGITLEEIVNAKTTHELIMWSLEKYEDLRPVLKQMSYDITCLGARQALINKGNELGLERLPMETEQRKLGNIGDFEFVNPQMYMSIKYVSSNMEYWDINYWSTNLKNIKKVGEVLLISEPEYIETKIKHSYNLQMLSTTLNNEIDQVANTHMAKLLNIADPSEIEYNLAIVNEYLTQE